MTDTLDTHEKISWDAYRPYALYGNGLRVTDIAVELGQAPGTVYNHMKDFPVEYAKSKHRHIAHRVAKYRRVGALAVDIQIDTLEGYKELLASEEAEAEKLAKMEQEYRDAGHEVVMTQIEYALKHKDGVLPPEDKMRAANEAAHKVACQRGKLNQIQAIRASLKDISAIGEAAEKRADLNEGKATERSESSLTVNLPGVVINMPEGLDDEPRAACVGVTVDMPEEST